MTMRIGIDATCWANDRGYGRFTRELVTAMTALAPGDEFVCLLDRRSADRFTLRGPHITSIVVDEDASEGAAAATTGAGRSPIDMLRFTKAAHRARLDVFFSPSVYGYFPLPLGLPAVVTVHDAIPERFPRLTLPTWRDRLFWRMKVRLALWQSRLVLTVSDYAAREVAKYLRVPPGRMRVTLEGVAAEYEPSERDEDVRAAAARAGVPPGARWLIYVGGFGPHKHVDVLVRAHAAVARRAEEAGQAPIVLLLVGPASDGFHQDIAAIRYAIDECGTASLVRWAGYLPDAELRHLHSGALALVLASASEGFGLPAVEAARCGTPVVATTESPLPELLEGGGLFVPPDDVTALTDAIIQLATNEERRRAFGQRARERACLLNWSASARVALDALHEAARMQPVWAVSARAGSNRTGSGWTGSRS
jgi:glycosyltransferase involved in cell wall biosynthesis